MASRTPGRPPADKDKRKGTLLQIRVTDEQKNLFEAAALREGLSISAWMRQVALHAARSQAEPERDRDP
jgi:uncharacterized protein (DUF1778 family)